MSDLSFPIPPDPHWLTEEECLDVERHFMDMHAGQCIFHDRRTCFWYFADDTGRSYYGPYRELRTCEAGLRWYSESLANDDDLGDPPW